MVRQSGGCFPFGVEGLQVIVTSEGMAAGGAEDFCDVEGMVFDANGGFVVALQEVADEGLEEGGIEQGDAQPAFLTGGDGEFALLTVTEAFEGGYGEGLTAVHVVDGFRQVGVYLLDDVEEGGVGEVALGGAETAVVGGDEADDEGVEGGGLDHGTFRLLYNGVNILLGR